MLARFLFPANVKPRWAFSGPRETNFPFEGFPSENATR
jgi:hypothetical protein